MNKKLLPQYYPVTCSTNHVGPGSIFIAIPGYAINGLDFVPRAIELGATTIVAPGSAREAATQLTERYPHINFEYTDNPRQEMALQAAATAGNPADKLRIIGITGTKGKSTTTHLIAHILKTAGLRVALIGGINNWIHDHHEASTLTTPDSDYLHQFFAACVSNAIDYVVMEVSSHALSLDRVYGIAFDHVGFTNLAPEHMDFYASLNEYWQAKMTLFKHVKPTGSACINIQDLWGYKTLATLPQGIAVSTFAETPAPTEYKPSNTHYILNSAFKNNGLTVTLTTNNDTLRLQSHTLFGDFNGYNITMAYGIARQAGIPHETIQQALDTFTGTPGRLQLHTLKNGAKAFVDFAHNPSSMEAVLRTLRPLTTHLIVVFGCGGDRDTTKRPVMGALAAHYANATIITDDNPRTENRLAIIEQIKAGMPQDALTKTICLPDRGEAIAHAAGLATSTSIIALLGKGHEAYYLIGDQKLHFDDYEEISQF